MNDTNDDDNYDIDDDRNPLVIPGARESTKLRNCPKCQSRNYTTRKVDGVFNFKCGDCGNQWQGGIGGLVIDQTRPHPPMNPADRPVVEWIRGKTGELVEERRRQDMTPAFRKGLPIPEGEDGDW